MAKEAGHVVEDRFRTTEQQQAVGIETVTEAFEDVPAGGGIKVDEHVAAEDEIELAQPIEVLAKVELLKADHVADGGVDLPQLALGGKVALAEGAIDPASKFEVRIGSGFRGGKDPGANVGAEEFWRRIERHFEKQDGEGVEFLTARGGGGPDTKAIAGTAIEEIGKQPLAKIGEDGRIAEKTRFVREQAGGDFVQEVAILGDSESMTESPEVGESLTGEQGTQTSFDEILFVGSEIHAGLLLEELPQVGVRFTIVGL
jgi:hypothetical protein